MGLVLLNNSLISTQETIKAIDVGNEIFYHFGYYDFYLYLNLWQS